MAASFDAVDEKLREADFFLTKMEETGPEASACRFYFSAFVTAARSVTFTLQHAMNGIPGFAEWYSTQQDRLRADPLSRYFTNVRNEVQKKGTNPVTFWARGENGAVEAFFLHWYDTPKEMPPDQSVLSACKAHMVALATLVYELYREFAHFVDPAVVYTPEGAARQGLTVEDIEEELTGVRGWTSGLPLEERFRLLRQNEPMPQVDDVLVKHLGHDRFGKPAEQRAQRDADDRAR